MGTVVLSMGLVINYVALIYWFLFNREVHRNPLMLRPALDAIFPHRWDNLSIQLVPTWAAHVFFGVIS